MKVLLTTDTKSNISFNLVIFKIIYFTIKLFIKNSEMKNQVDDYHISLVASKLPFIILSVLV